MTQSVKKIVYGGLLIAIGVILPQLFHIFGQSAGQTFFADAHSGNSSRYADWTGMGSWRCGYCSDSEQPDYGDAAGTDAVFHAV